MIEPIDPQLAALFAAEQPVPPVSAALQERVLARVGKTLGWGAAGATGAKLAGALAVIALIGGIAWSATRGGDAKPEAPSATRDVITPRPAAPRDIPRWFADPDRPAVRISGRVVRDGAPVGGARVVLTSYLTLAGLREPVELVTGSDGTFDFGEHVATTYDVTASADGMGWGHARIAPTDPHRAPGPSHVLVHLSGCEHVIVGTVRDASGGAIAGARIAPARGRAADATPIAAAVITGGDGRFELCTRAGWQQLIVTAGGYGGVMLADEIHGRRVIDVSLVPEAAIVGRVVRADDGTPVRGARVWLRAEDYPGAVAPRPDVAATDGDGRFRLAGVAPGRHMVSAETDELLWTFVPVVVMPGEESPVVELRLPTAVATVRGVVTADGEPVAGARIGVFQHGMKRSAMAADDAGAFVLRLRQPGATSFVVDGYEVIAPSAHDPAVAGDGAIIVEVARMAEIHGRVEGAWHGVVIARGPALPAGVKTDIAPDGTFALTGLPAGRYELGAQSDAAEAFTSDAGVVAVEVDARERRDGVVIPLDGRAVIAGVVRDEHDAPVADVHVEYARADGDLCRARTDDAGRFTCTMLAGGGVYVPSVKADAGSTIVLGEDLAAVDVADGATRIDDVVLRVRASRATVHGRVVDDGGAPVADVAVRAIEVASGRTPATAPWLGDGVRITDADGRFELPAWDGARYVVHARAADGSEGQVAVAAGGDADVVLAAPGRIRGVLRGFEGRPTVMVRALGNTVDAVYGRIDGDQVTVDGLAPGRYGVMATAGAEGASAVVDVTSGGVAAVVLEARAKVRLTGRVIEARSRAPVAGARCFAGPTIPGAGVFAQGAGAAPTSADGTFTLDVSGGIVEVGCLYSGTFTEGAAWRDVGAGGAATIEVLVVRTTDRAGGRLGETVVSTHGDHGFRHAIRGEEIVSIDGVDVAALTDDALATLIATHAPGSDLDLVLEARTLRVTLE